MNPSVEYQAASPFLVSIGISAVSIYVQWKAAQNISEWHKDRLNRSTVSNLPAEFGADGFTAWSGWMADLMQLFAVCAVCLSTLAFGDTDSDPILVLFSVAALLALAYVYQRRPEDLSADRRQILRVPIISIALLSLGAGFATATA